MKKKLYDQLVKQLGLLYQENHLKSVPEAAKLRPYFRKFLCFITTAFSVGQLCNIQRRHVDVYIENMRDRNLPLSEIIIHIQAIRLFQQYISDSKFSMPTDQELGLADICTIDLAWVDEVLRKMIHTAEGRGYPTYPAVMLCARRAGLRLGEAFHIRTADIGFVVLRQELYIPGKGDKERSVPIAPVLKNELYRLMNITEHSRLLHPDWTLPNTVAADFENFLRRYRPAPYKGKSANAFTYTLLRYCFARERYQELLQSGHSEAFAVRQIGRLMGYAEDAAEYYLNTMDEPA